MVSKRSFDSGKNIVAQSDSELLVRQVDGENRIKEKLKELSQRALVCCGSPTRIVLFT